MDNSRLNICTELHICFGRFVRAISRGQFRFRPNLSILLPKPQYFCAGGGTRRGGAVRSGTRVRSWVGPNLSKLGLVPNYFVWDKIARGNILRPHIYCHDSNPLPFAWFIPHPNTGYVIRIYCLSKTIVCVCRVPNT